MNVDGVAYVTSTESNEKIDRKPLEGITTLANFSLRLLVTLYNVDFVVVVASFDFLNREYSALVINKKRR